ncbi:lysostaphin resistance A-like protein [Streptococcus sp. H31]|uniref:CPBP family intramembrane glutamic endopeptidase n=1 Tax=Streptococcus huangxiaojuni TaxID=3237239 RepID=UPI0034A4A7B3
MVIFKKIFHIFGIIVLAYSLAFIPLLFLGLAQMFANKGLLDSYSYDLLDLFSTGMAILFVYVLYRRDSEILLLEKDGLLKKYGLGFLAGGGVLFFIWIIAVSLGIYRTEWIFKWSYLPLLIPLLIGYMIQGMSEEVIFRGVMQSKLNKLLSSKASIILTALAFAAMHLVNSGMTVIAFLDLIVFSLIMGMIRQQADSLWFVSAYHSAWNFFQGPVFGSSVSGNTANALVFHSTNQSSQVWLSGGEFGLESSAITLTVDIILLICLYRYYYSTNAWPKSK